MSEKRNMYRRYALAFATFSAAISIGFFMQTNEAVSAANASDQNSLKAQPSKANKGVSTLLVGHSTPEMLPEIPADFSQKTVLPSTPLIMIVSRDLPVGALPQEEKAPKMGCDVELSAEAAAGAMVKLSLSAQCLTGEEVTFHHNALRFTEVVGDDGLLEVTVPALSESAVFAVVFPNGDGEMVTTDVTSTPFYDRAAVVWQGDSGLQLHAREFGAEYSSPGHVWMESARDVSAVAGGQGGFITRLGNAAIANGWTAEIYTFPTLTTKRHGDVALSIEAEVVEANCNRELTAKSVQMHAGGKPLVQEISLFMPDCSAKGEFLVLNNPLEDLRIAQN